MRSGQRGRHGSDSRDARSRRIHIRSVYIAEGLEEGMDRNEQGSYFMDRSFLAIATMLHRAPRAAGEQRDKKAGPPRPADREPDLRDVPDGWIRFAL